MICEDCGEEGHADASDRRCPRNGNTRAQKRRRGASLPGEQRTRLPPTAGSEGLSYACGALWEVHAEPKQYRVVSPAEAAASPDLDKRVDQHIVSVMQKLEMIWPETALGLDTSVSVLDAMFYVLGDARTQIFDWTRKRMLAAHTPKPLEEWELLSFLGMALWHHLSVTSEESSFRAIEGVCIVLRRSGVEAILSPERFAEIKFYLSGFDHGSTLDSAAASNFEQLETSLAYFMLRRLGLGKHSVAIARGLPSTMGLFRPSHGAGSSLAQENISVSCYDAILPLHLFSVHSHRRARAEQTLVRALVDLKTLRRVETLHDVQVSFDLESPGTDTLAACAGLGCGVIARVLEAADSPSPLPGPLASASCASSPFCVQSTKLHGFTSGEGNLRPDARAIAVTGTVARDRGCGSRRFLAVHQQAGVAFFPADLDCFVVASPLPPVAEPAAPTTLFFSSGEGDVEPPAVEPPEHHAESLGFRPRTGDSAAGKVREEAIWPVFEDESEWKFLGDGADAVMDTGKLLHIGSDGGGESGNDDGSDAMLSLSHLASEDVVTASAMEKLLRRRLEPVTISQSSADYQIMQAFMLTEEVSGLLLRDPLDEYLGGTAGGQGSESAAAALSGEALAAELCREWVQHPRERTPQTALAMLQELAFVESVFGAGLLHLLAAPMIGTSPAGICVVEGPGVGMRGRAGRILCAAEVYMCSLASSALLVREVVAKHGAYFGCEVGSRTWFEAVPPPCRSRMLHAAAVMGTSHALFSMAVHGVVVYTVLVSVPHALRASVIASLRTSALRFAAWAWASLAESSEDEDVGDIAASSIPDVFEGESCAAALSIYKVWHALHTRCRKQGPLPPLCALQSLVAATFDSSRAGLVAFDKVAAQLSARPGDGAPWESRYVQSKILAAVTNSAVLWHANQSWKESKVEGVRKAIKSEAGVVMADFVEQLSLQLLSRASVLRDERPGGVVDGGAAEAGENGLTPLSSSFASSIGMAPVQVYEASSTPSLSAEQHLKLRLPDKKRGVLEMANSPSVRQLRLSANVHEEHTLDKARRCVVCGEAARKHCVFCNVVLHKQIKYSTKQRTSCWTQWHSAYSIKRNDMSKKPRSLRTDALGNPSEGPQQDNPPPPPAGLPAAAPEEDDDDDDEET